MKKFTVLEQKKMFNAYKEKSLNLLNVKLNLYSMHTFSYNRDEMIKDYEKDLNVFIDTFIEEGLKEELVNELK